ncbi:hypothetical protein NKI82_05565 [Mesorhizobium sp. M0482]
MHQPIQHLSRAAIVCRGDALQKRRELMAAWSSYVTGSTADAKVVPLRA